MRSHAADRAVRIAHALETDTTTMVGTFLRRPNVYADTVIAADDDEAGGQEFTARVRAAVAPDEMRVLLALSNIASNTPSEELIALRRWSQARVVYTVDADAAAEIERTDFADTVIPGEALRRLPHPNPLVVLPAPVRIPNTSGFVERYEAFIVTGFRDGRRRCDTHAENATGFVLHFLGRIVDPVTDRAIPVETTRFDGTRAVVSQVIGLRVLVTFDDLTMQQRNHAAVADILQSGPTGLQGFATLAEIDDVTSSLCTLGLALLVYLVSDHADIAAISSVGLRKSRKKSATVDTSPTTVVEVGYVLGAALRATRSAETRSGSVSGRTVRPHMRRAHLHTFRRGPGRTERFIKWLPPTAVSWKPDTKPVTTVHVR